MDPMGSLKGPDHNILTRVAQGRSWCDIPSKATRITSVLRVALARSLAPGGADTNIELGTVCGGKSSRSYSTFFGEVGALFLQWIAGR